MALAATASAVVSRGGHGDPEEQQPSKRELKQGHHRQLTNEVTHHNKLNDIKETQQIHHRKHNSKRELRKTNYAKHSKVHHDKKEHKKHHKKSHKCHGHHHKEAVIPVETTTPLDLFAKLTPISFEGSAHFFIVGRSGELFISHTSIISSGLIVMHDQHATLMKIQSYFSLQVQTSPATP